MSVFSAIFSPWFTAPPTVSPTVAPARPWPEAAPARSWPPDPFPTTRGELKNVCPGEIKYNRITGVYRCGIGVFDGAFDPPVYATEKEKEEESFFGQASKLVNKIILYVVLGVLIYFFVRGYAQKLVNKS